MAAATKASNPVDATPPDSPLAAFGLFDPLGDDPPLVGDPVGELELVDVDDGEPGAVPLGDMTLSRTWMRPLFVLCASCQQVPAS